MALYPLILSGGAGSRLWPVSRSSQPKQFLPLWSDQPMIVDTARRVARTGFAPPTVVCNQEHRFMVADAFHQAGLTPLRILLEPCARNTAGAIAVGSVFIAATDPNALVLVLPSDHVIEDEAAFHAAIAVGAKAAESGHLVTFGIDPTRAETGYGYIQKGEGIAGIAGVSRIHRFVEKPDRKTAEALLASGDHTWNAGIFLFQARTVVDALQHHAPEVLGAAQAALSQGREDLDFLRLDADAFAAMPSQPFDIAVMERTDRGAVVPVSMGWSDVGSWDSLWLASPRDGEGNRLVGDVLSLDSRNSLVWSNDGLLTAVVGVDNLAVVVQNDAVLVAERSRAEQVKTLVDHLKAQNREIHAFSRTVARPWGAYPVIDSGPHHIVKRLTLNVGGRLSLQYHNHRAEHWVVVSGTATVTRGDEVFDLKANQSVYIPQGMVHRLENGGTEVAELIEVQTGSILREDDIVRLDDCYGRSGGKGTDG